MKWRGTPKNFVVMLGLMMSLALLPGLVACASGGSPIDQVISRLQDDLTPVDENVAEELKRFEQVYDRYAEDPGNREKLSYFRFAFKRVRANYVHQVEETTLIDAAIKGVEERDPKPAPGSIANGKLVEDALHKMVHSLDPHSSYMDAEEFRESFVQTKGEFGGLGIQVTMENDRVKVIAPIEDTPAERAGVVAGDLITHVDGIAIGGKTLSEAVRLMRGKPGTSISLTLRRGESRTLDVSIERAVIQVKSVRWHSEGDVGYIRITRFSEKTEGGLQKAFESLHKELGTRLSGVVLDLRNNPGGLLDQSLKVADAFLDRGEIVSVRGRAEEDYRSFRAEKGDAVRGVPIVVLINGGSASASEIVASALQHWGRATLMGRTTFGKGSVQTIMPLPVEGALRLTTALYYAPSGETIQARGVAPDIRLEPVGEGAEELANRQREKDLPNALPPIGRTEGGETPTVSEGACPEIGEAKDRALGCAIAYLEAGSPKKFLASVGNRSPI